VLFILDQDERVYSVLLQWYKDTSVLYISLIVPGGSDGPSGVLVCCENYIIYKNFGDQTDIRCPIPRRRVSITL